MLPIGIIALWRGNIATIPPGWSLCDGTNGTPNLRDRFIVGAGDSYAPDASGGSTSHTHPFTGDGHFHTLGLGGNITAGVGRTNTSTTDPTTGTTDSASTLPPFYALAYIMRI